MLDVIIIINVVKMLAISRPTGLAPVLGNAIALDLSTQSGSTLSTELDDLLAVTTGRSILSVV